MRHRPARMQDLPSAPCAVTPADRRLHAGLRISAPRSEHEGQLRAGIHTGKWTWSATRSGESPLISSAASPPMRSLRRSSSPGPSGTWSSDPESRSPTAVPTNSARPRAMAALRGHHAAGLTRPGSQASDADRLSCPGPRRHPGPLTALRQHYTAGRSAPLEPAAPIFYERCILGGLEHFSGGMSHPTLGPLVA